jgi:hypothetical protein
LTAFARQVADDIATLREAEAKGEDDPELKRAVYEGKRRLLSVLDVQVTLFMKDGKRKGKITAKYCSQGQHLPLEGGENLLVSSIDTGNNGRASGLTIPRSVYRG